MGACVEALTESVLMAPLDSRYTQVGFNLIPVQVCPLREVSQALTCILVGRVSS